MHTLRETARQWLAQGRSAMVVSVMASRGSVPREAGTRMLVAADAVAGTIGGGHLEWQALAAARALLAAPPAHAHPAPGEAPHPMPQQPTLPPLPSQQVRHYPLGPALGQCCGGAVTLLTQRLSAEVLRDWPLPAPLLRLQLHGAGHVGTAIARLLATVACDLDWVDCREPQALPSDAATAALPLHTLPRQEDDPAAAVADAPPGSCYLVMTHRHDLDLQIVHAILRRADAGFVGLIGSATKRARFVHRLRERGLSQPALQALHCPIGVPGIPGKAPAEIAVAVVAQLLQHAAATPAQLCASRSSASVSITRSV